MTDGSPRESSKELGKDGNLPISWWKSFYNFGQQFPKFDKHFFSIWRGNFSPNLGKFFGSIFLSPQNTHHLRHTPVYLRGFLCPRPLFLMMSLIHNNAMSYFVLFESFIYCSESINSLPPVKRPTEQIFGLENKVCFFYRWVTRQKLFRKLAFWEHSHSVFYKFTWFIIVAFFTLFSLIFH